MDNGEISFIMQTNSVLDKIKRESPFSNFVDFSLPIPKTFKGSNEIRLIILGQDPTVERKESRKNVKVVLNLDKSNALRKYVEEICNFLNVGIEYVFATNCVKNYFVDPPTKIISEFPRGVFPLVEFIKFWLPNLKEELSDYKNVPTILLGQPILRAVISENQNPNMRYYWGYDKSWRSGMTKEFHLIQRCDNILNRKIFPFPHQPCISRNKYYQSRFEDYIQFMRDNT